MTKQYLKDNATNKVYDEDTLASVIAVDPNHWDTDIQILKEKAEHLKSQADDIINNQIPTKEEERDDFFSKFPELK